MDSWLCLTRKIDRDEFFKDWQRYAVVNSYDDWHRGVHIVKRMPTIDNAKVVGSLGYSPGTVRVLVAYAEFHLREANVKPEIIQTKLIPIEEIVDVRSKSWWKDREDTVSVEELAKERGLDPETLEPASLSPVMESQDVVGDGRQREA